MNRQVKNLRRFIKNILGAVAVMQVKIDDSVEADNIFTILMGDQVEPRREFIETNALNVQNLDV